MTGPIFHLLGFQNAVQRALELRHRLEGETTDGIGYAWIQDLQAGLDPLPDDGDPGFVLRGADVHQEPPFEPGPEMCPQAPDLSRWPIAGEDHLFPVRGESIEGQEEESLDIGLSCEELHVIHKKHVQLLVPRSHFLLTPSAGAFDELPEEILRSLEFNLLVRGHSSPHGGRSHRECVSFPIPKTHR